MSRIIEILLEEHRNIEKLLLVLEQELKVFDHGERPDYEIMQAITQYFEDYPEICHHPKEDMVFKKLKLRDPAAAQSVGDVEAEHEVETKRLRRFAQAVENVLTDQEFLRETFHNIVRDFIEHQRQHMNKEERFLFPAAIKSLQAEDWTEIDARLNDRNDPLFNGVVEEKYHTLQRTILRWEEETETNRVKSS
jgi:hemerythrin-like domain-containing protein